VKVGAILLCGDDIAEFRRRVRLVEDLGYDLLGVGDVPVVYRELFVALTLAVEDTRRIRLAPMVTNPVSRNPGVIASAMCALDELSGGRMVLGIGAGGGPLFSLGLRVPGREQLKGGVRFLRAQLRLPVYLAAYGPRTTRLAGELADGIIYAGGVSAGAISGARELVAAGASAAGRNPLEVDFWVMTRAAVASTRSEALVGIRANLASAGAHGLRSDVQLNLLPADVRERMVELQRRYDQSEHVRWDGKNARLVDELGLTEFLARQFAIAGDAADVRSRLAELEAAGVTQVIVPAVDREPERFLEAFIAAARG
jgi:alkanesulfonate monooxygenase SsuD/methylene tetrahydromethanopterin reductase-like flavin-dependent oxidoreductase (luciferase family)